MIGALTQRQSQFRQGKYLGIDLDTNVKNALFFTYELVGEREKRYNHIIQNLITSEENVVIRTNYNRDWRMQGFVQLQDGHKYIINSIREYEEEVNPQVYSTVISGADKIYYMELIGADEDNGEL